jgi:putative peptide zinc metalloprotease protein
VASLFKPLFFPPVWMAALASLVALDFWLFVDHGVAQAFRQALQQPVLMLLLVALVVLAAGWHEFGHAAGCAYGGACPGVMGAGIYLAYPAFYTDVTDSYRLDRRGRLRTDLAGVYFNTLFVLATAALYAATRWEALILVIVVQHIEIAHQLLPFLRLDGYYIVADATGVPDLFARIKPIFVSLLPWRKPDPAVTQLKPWVRAAVTVWVLLVVPLLLFQLGEILIHAPRIAATAWESVGKQGHELLTGFGSGDILKGLLAGVQIVILVIPLVGIVVTLARLATRLGLGLWRATAGNFLGRALAVAGGLALVAGVVYVLSPRQEYTPIRKGERGTLGESIAAVRRLPSGRSGLTSYDRAVRRGAVPELEPREARSAPSEATTSPAPGSTPASVAPRHDGQDTPTTVSRQRTPTTYTTRATTRSTADRSPTGPDAGRTGTTGSDTAP